MQLSTLSILLGLAVAVPNMFGILKPGQYAGALRRFPRNTALGYVLMIAATVWFVWNVRNENIADFEPMKPFMANAAVLEFRTVMHAVWQNGVILRPVGGGRSIG